MADGKWIEGLTPGMPIEAAATDVLAARLAAVRHCLQPAVERADEDPEHVHQLRVATRRAAAAIRVFSDCLPRKHEKAAKKALKQIRRAAGDARDWDVFLLGLPAIKALGAAAGKPALDFLVGYGMGERAAAQGRLAEAVADATPAFSDECENLPRAARPPRGNSPPATFGELATRHLGELIGSLTIAAEANPTQPPQLHQLRILAKRVRYALEVFVECVPPVFKDGIYPAVERVQELLGEVQDARVGLERLTGLRDRVKRTLPVEWPRLRKGFEGLMGTLRTKVPRGRSAFQKWRKEWANLAGELRIEIDAATVTVPA